jgi:two-component system, NtrC family, sensor kinase
MSTVGSEGPRAMGENVAAAGARSARQPGLKVTTGGRLFFAFSVLVCAFLAVLLFATTRLRAIESALDSMRRHEDQLRLAIELKSAVRDEVGHQAQVVSGDRRRLADYREARERVLGLQRQLPLHGRAASEHLAAEADELSIIAGIERACDDVARLLDARVDEALAGGAPAGSSAERAHERVMLIEDRLDRLCAREHDTAARLRGVVADIQRSTLRWLVVFCAATTLFAVAVGWYIRRSVARPVARLGEGAARLARGDLTTRIEIDSADEFGALAAQFNAMTDALKTHQEKLVQSEMLAGVGRLAAGFAHELNNPLSVILGYLMIHRRKAEGRLARDLAVAEDEALRCREIVRDLLELSRPNRPGDLCAVDLRHLCEEVVTALRDSGQLTAPRIVIDGQGVARGSRAKLHQVIVNLIRNAAEAAGANGAVEVTVRTSGAAAQVIVSDTGAGIAPASRDRLFEPFFTTKPTGTGLGLAVSRAIARAHGGDIAIMESGAGGACFTLNIPLARGST